ncbi:MAG TPA: ABC transporter permease [Gemmatimonadaceae bacterium]|nr:ABC transporter permease [Gemmatimonadaceae bacterium]
MFGQPWLAAEVRTALRAIVRRPATSALLVFTIGLGVGATTSIFTVVDAVLLRPLPFHEPEQLANIWTMEKNGFAHPGVAREVADRWSGDSSLFAQVESFVDRSMLYRGADEPTEVRATFVSRGLFSLLGVRADIGRTTLDEDMVAAAPDVAVVSDEFWRTRLGADRGAIGRAIVLDGRQYLVIGVMPSWFRYPLGRVSMWLPMKPGALTANEQRQVNLVGRIRGGVTPAAAQERVRQLSARLDETSPRPNGWAVGLFFLGHNMVNADVRTGLWVLSGAVLCLLLIACANAANVLLVRTTARQRELSIRSALGATRAALVRQLLVESAVLALLGGAAGVLAAYWGVDLLLMIVPDELSFLTYSSIGVDGRVLAFAVVASIATGLLFGVGPALRASRARGTFLVQERSGTSSRGANRMRGALIVAEVALSLALLVGASLFARSFARLNGVDPGFDANSIISAQLSISATRYPTPEQRSVVIEAYRDRLRAIPGIVGVAVSTGLPPRTGITFADAVEAEGGAGPLNAETITIPFAEADTAYFATLGIQLVRGRAFTSEDRRASDSRVIIDPDLARALWPTADPIGRRLRLSPDGKWHTVVGVAEDVKLMGPDDAAGKYGIYFALPTIGRATRFVEFVLRTSGDPARLIEPVKRAVWSLDPQQPIQDVATARERMADALAKPRFLLTLMGVFAGVALGLAAVGVYGVLSSAVAQRTREIGIRMALGAQTADVLRAVLGHGLTLIALGTVLGVSITAAGGRVVRSLLFGVEPLDPMAYAIAAATLVVAAVAACYIPARRATRVDPMVAVRAD